MFGGSIWKISHYFTVAVSRLSPSTTVGCSDTLCAINLLFMRSADESWNNQLYYCHGSWRFWGDIEWRSRQAWPHGAYRDCFDS